MKKLIQILCSIFFASTVTLLADAHANTIEDINNNTKEQVSPSSEPDNYTQTMTMEGFAPHLSKMETASNADFLLLFVNDPNGKKVKDAQVITTVIHPHGRQRMNRAQPFKGGYQVFVNDLSPGCYRLEVEIVTNGRLLTDEFSFVKS